MPPLRRSRARPTTSLLSIAACSAVSLFFLSRSLNNQNLRGSLDTSSPHNHTIIDIISATSFQINSETGKIKFPKNITTVVLDVGARHSDYLSVLEKETDDPTVALILIDPLPDSSIPLMKRVAEFSMQNWKGGESFLDQDKSNQVFLLRAAVGENEGIANLNVAAAPACTSILQTSALNEFWCARSSGSIKVPIITFDGLLGLLPEGIKQIHVKIDTEGADLAVLRGASKTLQRIDTVVIECNSDTANETFRDDECKESHALEYMKERNFKNAHVERQGGLVNIFFARDDYDGPLPGYLLHGGLTFHKFYQEFAMSHMN